MIRGGQLQNVMLKRKVPVLLAYWTAWVDSNGVMNFRKDVYGRDAAMLSLMKNNRGKDLEMVVAHSQPSYSRPAGAFLSTVSPRGLRPA